MIIKIINWLFAGVFVVVLLSWCMETYQQLSVFYRRMQNEKRITRARNQSKIK